MVFLGRTIPILSRSKQFYCQEALEIFLHVFKGQALFDLYELEKRTNCIIGDVR